MKLSTHTLAAALLFAGVKDVRYYLNGVMVERSASGGARLVATDGHTLMAIRDENADSSDLADGERVILPSAAVAWAIKAKAETVEFTRGAAPFAWTVAAGDAVLSATAIDGRFPDFEAVVPLLTDAPPAEVGAMNPVYFERAAKAAKHICGKRYAALLLSGGGLNRAVRVDFCGLMEGLHAVAVLMPLRADSGPSDEWSK